MTLKVESRQEMTSGGIRYQLSNGWFMMRGRRRAHYIDGWRYGIYAPTLPNVPAIFVGGADTLKGALEVATARQQAADANLTRMAFGKEFR